VVRHLAAGLYSGGFEGGAVLVVSFKMEHLGTGDQREHQVIHEQTMCAEHRAQLHLAERA